MTHPCCCAACEGARDDARRYRWLRSATNTVPMADFLRISEALGAANEAELDRAIDEVMANETQRAQQRSGAE